MTQLLNLEFSKKYFEGYNVSGIGDPFIQIGLSDVPAALYDVFDEFTPLAILFMLVGLASTAALQRKGEDVALLAWLLVPVALFTVYFRHDYYAAAIAPPIAILAARGMESIALRFGKRSITRALAGLLILFAAVELYALASASPGISADEQLREFAAGLPSGSVVLTEPKIDTINAVFAFAKQDAFGLPVMNFVPLVEKAIKAGNQPSLVADTYYIVCEQDNCGWDWLTAPFMRNQSERYNSILLPQGIKMREIYEGKTPVYGIYMMKTSFPPAVTASFRRIVFFGEAIGRPELSDDVYALRSPADKLFNSIAHIPLYAGVALAFMAPVLAFYLLLKQKEEGIGLG